MYRVYVAAAIVLASTACAESGQGSLSSPSASGAGRVTPMAAYTASDPCAALAARGTGGGGKPVEDQPIWGYDEGRCVPSYGAANVYNPIDVPVWEEQDIYVPGGDQIRWEEQ